MSTSRNSEIPSTPKCHEIPNDFIHAWRSSNWKSPCFVTNSESRYRLDAPEMSEKITATWRTRSARALGISATTAAPISGTRIITSSGLNGAAVAAANTGALIRSSS